MTAAAILFAGFGVSTALAFLIGLALGRNPVNAALAFCASMLSLSGALATLEAHALASALLWLQAGAVLAVVSFGIGLQNLESPGFVPGRDRGLKLVAAVALAVAVAESIRALLASPGFELSHSPAGLRSFGRELFSDALLVTELVPLLLAATAVSLAALLHRESET